MPRYSPKTGLLQEYQVGPFDQEHIYVQASGTLPGAERFSWGLRMAKASGGNGLWSAPFMASVVAAVSAYHSSAGCYLSPLALLNSVKVNLVGTNGKYVEAGTHETVLANVPGFGNTGQTPANQIAMAVSLTTGFSRGPAHRGRYFLPLPTNSIGVDGRFSASSADEVSDATDTFISALNAAGPDWKVAVFSRKAGSPSHRLVIGNEVGRVYDTQRRRRRSLVEDYQ